MTGPLRKVVTTEGPDGRSFVLSDGLAGTAEVGAMDLEVLWRNESAPEVDVNLVLSGEVVLELDEGEVALRAGDLAVVNSSRHAWQNRSSEPVRVLSTIVGATRTRTP